jgi:hypothetical protein
MWPMPERLTFTAFVDFVLARLYELDDGEFHDVKAIAAELRYPVAESWPYDAVNVLESRGLVVEAMGFGKPDATISGAGRLFVEEQERVSASVIQEYRARPSSFVVVAGTGNQVVVGSDGVRQTTSPAETE